jgi:hypothetical protein
MMGFEAVGDEETRIWRQPWFGEVWMLEFEKQHRYYLARHTDAAAAGGVVLFNVNACGFIAGNVVLHTMEILEDTEEVVLSTIRQYWMDHHLWHQRLGVEAAS